MTLFYSYVIFYFQRPFSDTNKAMSEYIQTFVKGLYPNAEDGVIKGKRNGVYACLITILNHVMKKPSVFFININNKQICSYLFHQLNFKKKIIWEFYKTTYYENCLNN